MCRLKAFCFRFSLRSGAIAAAVHTALGLLSMLGYGGCIIYFAHYYDVNPIHYDDPGVKHPSNVDREDVVLILYIVGTLFLLVTLFKLISLIIFCVGIHKNRSGLVLVWLIWTAIEIILLPCLITVAAILTVDYFVFLGLLYVLCMLYLYLATCSYYKDLAEGFLRPSPL